MTRDLTHCFVKIPVKPLDEASMEKVKMLEHKLGFPLIAFAAHNDEYAELNDAQIKEINALGKEINAAIVAYSNQKQTKTRPRVC